MNTDEINEILEEHAKNVYYEGDPKRGGISQSEASQRLSELIVKDRKKYLEHVIKGVYNIDLGNPMIAKEKAFKYKVSQHLRAELQALHQDNNKENI